MALFLEAVNVVLDKWISQPSSHNCPRDNNGDFNSEKRCASFAGGDSADVRGNSPTEVDFITESSAKWTVGPLVGRMFSSAFL